MLSTPPKSKKATLVITIIRTTDERRSLRRLHSTLPFFRQMLAQPPISHEPISKLLSMTTLPTIPRASADSYVQDVQTEARGQRNRHLGWRARDQNTDVGIMDHGRARVASAEDNHTPFYLPCSCTLPFLVSGDTDDSQDTWVADFGAS